MNRRLLAPAAAVLALGGFLAACGDDKKSKDELIEQIADVAGITEEKATCVYDSLGDDASDFLNQSADEADDADVQRINEAISGCVGGDLTVPEVSVPDLGSISVPDLSMPDVGGITLRDLDVDEDS